MVRQQYYQSSLPIWNCSPTDRRYSSLVWLFYRWNSIQSLSISPALCVVVHSSLLFEVISSLWSFIFRPASCLCLLRLSFGSQTLPNSSLKHNSKSATCSRKLEHSYCKGSSSKTQSETAVKTARRSARKSLKTSYFCSLILRSMVAMEGTVRLRGQKSKTPQRGRSSRVRKGWKPGEVLRSATKRLRRSNFSRQSNFMSAGQLLSTSIRQLKSLQTQLPNPLFSIWAWSAD